MLPISGGRWQERDLVPAWVFNCDIFLLHFYRLKVTFWFRVVDNVFNNLSPWKKVLTHREKIYYSHLGYTSSRCC